MSEANNPKPLDSSIASGMGWMAALQVLLNGVSIISTLVLARLLVPDDFGIYVTSMALFSFVQLIRAFGFGMALIQNQAATPDHYNTAWTLHLCFSVLCASILYFCAVPFSEFLDEPRLATVAKILALVFVLDGFTNIGIFDLQKDMQFDREFIRQLTIKLAGFVVTVGLAIYLRDYWAMVYGSIASTLCSVVLSYGMHPFRPRISFGKSLELLKFSSWLQLNNLLNYANQHIQNIVVSKVSGTGAVGLLSLSRDVGASVSMQLLEPLNRAAYPGFAKANNEPGTLNDLYLGVFAGLALLAFPMGVGIYALASLLVPMLLGLQWMDAIPVIELLALASIAMVLATPVHYALLAVARQNITSMLHGVRLLVLLLLIVPLASSDGARGAAMALLLTSVLMFGVSTAAIAWALKIEILDLANALTRPLLGVVTMYLFLQYLMTLNIVGGGGFILELMHLIGLVLAGAIVFSLAVLLTWYLQGRPDGPESILLELLRKNS